MLKSIAFYVASERRAQKNAYSLEKYLPHKPDDYRT